MKAAFTGSRSAIAIALLLGAVACGAQPELGTAVAGGGEGVTAQPPAEPAPGELPPDHPPLAPPPGGGEGQLPAGHPPVTTTTGMEAIPPVPEGAGTGQDALVWSVPESWQQEPPASSMRRAQYRLPGSAGDGECVVFYFGPGQGGPARANAERWAGQFAQPDGSSPLAAMVTAERQVGGLRVTTVEVTGTYGGGMMMGGGPPPAPQPDAMLLGAIAEGPDANWFFKCTGPAATLETHREGFDGMIASLRSGGGGSG